MAYDPENRSLIQGGKFFKKARSRMAQLAANNLGISYRGSGSTQISKVRDENLDLLDKYYEGTQYDHLEPWDSACASEDYVAVRRRRPRINYRFAKTLASRIASKLVGNNSFPTLSVNDDPDTTEFLKVLQSTAQLSSRLLEPMRRMVNSGAVFVRFYAIQQAMKVEWFNSKYCYPVFDATGDLEQIEIRYVYSDPDDKDDKGKPKEKWFKMILGKMSDVVFDSPIYKSGVEPMFEEVERVDHELGFVQGEWFRTCENKYSPDGYGLSADITDFIDELNYSLSQSSQAISYNQDPQMIISGMNEDELSDMIKSSTKAWTLGREGKASFMESNLGGVQRAIEFRDKIRLGIQDIARVVLIDPEKAVAHAQSAKAMEVLHGPFVELINELRPMVEVRLISMVLKMALMVLSMESRGEVSPISIPSGYQPQSLAITATWPPIFPLTINDLKEIAQLASTLTAANLFSRDWATEWLAKHKEFGVQDPELEKQRVASQPVINPFGAF